jgi:hypothetical protein
MLSRICLAAVAVTLSAAAPAAAEDLKFLLINETSAPLREFYTSPVDVQAWEADVFGEGVLGSGESVTITIADGRSQCDYDMKFVMGDGAEHIEQGINLCEMGSYTLSEE